MEQSERHKKLADYWAREIKAGVKYKERYAKSKEWEEYKKMFRGDWKENLVPVNKVFSFGRMTIARSYFRRPAVTVTPKRPEFEIHARVVEAIDNYLIRECNLKYTLKRALLDAFCTGTGPIRPPQDVVIPWGYRDFEDLPWICDVVIRPLKDVREDQKYNNYRAQIQGKLERDKGPLKTPIAPSDTNDDDRYALLYEIRDAREKKIIVISEGYVLLEEEDALQIEGLPWEFIIPNPDPDCFWGIPDVRMMKAQQEELNEIRTQASRHRRIALLKFLYAKGALSKENLDKLLGEFLGPGIEVNSDNVTAAVQLLQPHVPPDFANEALMVLQDMRETLGFSRNQLGEFAGQRTPPTAAESLIVQAATEVRIDERRDITADVLANILRKWNQYIFSFWNRERIVRILGPNGVRYWIRFTGEEIRGEYTITVDPESGLPITRGLRYQQARELFRLLLGNPYIDQTLLHKLLLEQFEWIDPTWPLIVKPEQFRQTLPTPPEGARGRPQGAGTPEEPETIEEVIRRARV